ncbi:hypothetical protein [Bradyrhizobium elkanii]|uniref:hypothetical protein n=1 Tax=Bradyrhizobium elkanii TaxID=29448 RepID=UPI002729DD63|nr:hypothetical protein [Bradyrhizobium elkanii]WLA80305.1 hypothetical protein QNJ99_33710 [Bradyrhizobium elkanii]
MAKPVFQFYFADEPQYATNCDRAWLANALRSYRKQSNRYEIIRIATHWYTVRVRGGSAVAVITI